MDKEDRSGTGMEEVKDLMSQFMCGCQDEGRGRDETVISVMCTARQFEVPKVPHV